MYVYPPSKGLRGFHRRRSGGGGVGGGGRDEIRGGVQLGARGGRWVGGSGVGLWVCKEGGQGAWERKENDRVIGRGWGEENFFQLR